MDIENHHQSTENGAVKGTEQQQQHEEKSEKAMKSIGTKTDREAVRRVLGDEILNDKVSDAMVERFLIATNGNVKLAAQRIRDTLMWYEQSKPDQVGCPACPKMPSSHYMHVACHDVRGRPVIYSCMALAQNKKYEDNLRHVLATLETCVLLLPPGETMWSWVMDFKGFSFRDVSLAPLGKTFLQILADHYPERLARFFVVDAPSVFSQMWKLVSPFIDPKTRTKIAFLPGPKQHHALIDGLREFFDEDNLNWLYAEMIDCRKKAKGEKFYDYGAILKLAENDEFLMEMESLDHCNLGSESLMKSLRDLAKAGNLPPQYARHAQNC